MQAITLAWPGLAQKVSAWLAWRLEAKAITSLPALVIDGSLGYVKEKALILCRHLEKKFVRDGRAISKGRSTAKLVKKQA